MASERSENQKLMPTPMHEDYIQIIHDNLARLGYSTRAEFVRDAIAEKLATLGIIVPPHLIAAPPRVRLRPAGVKPFPIGESVEVRGRGIGPVYPAHIATGEALNDAPAVKKARRGGKD